MNDDDELMGASEPAQQVPSDKPELGKPQPELGMPQPEAGMLPKYLESSQIEEQKFEEKQEDEEEDEYGE